MIKEPNFKAVGFSTCEMGATKQNKAEQSTACRQKVHDNSVTPSLWTVKFDRSGRQLRELEDGGEQPQAKRAKTKETEETAEAAPSATSSSNFGSLVRRRLTGKRTPGGQHEEEPNLKQAKTEDDATVECLNRVVAEAVDYTGKALSTVNDAMREHEPTMALKRVTPTTQPGGEDERDQEH